MLLTMPKPASALEFQLKGIFLYPCVMFFSLRTLIFFIPTRLTIATWNELIHSMLFISDI